jgi:hypothetical protein
LNFKGTPSQEEHKTSFTAYRLIILENQFSKPWWPKAILQGKGDSGLLHSGIDDIPVSHLTETEKCPPV